MRHGDGQPETAIWPPKAEVLITPTANLESPTTASSKTMYLGDSDNDRQPEVTAETGNTYVRN